MAKQSSALGAKLIAAAWLIARRAQWHHVVCQRISSGRWLALSRPAGHRSYQWRRLKTRNGIGIISSGGTVRSARTAVPCVPRRRAVCATLVGPSAAALPGRRHIISAISVNNGGVALVSGNLGIGVAASWRRGISSANGVISIRRHRRISLGISAAA